MHVVEHEESLLSRPAKGTQLAPAHGPASICSAPPDREPNTAPHSGHLEPVAADEGCGACAGEQGPAVLQDDQGALEAGCGCQWYECTCERRKVRSIRLTKHHGQYVTISAGCMRLRTACAGADHAAGLASAPYPPEQPHSQGTMMDPPLEAPSGVGGAAGGAEAVGVAEPAEAEEHHRPEPPEEDEDDRRINLASLAGAAS